MSYRYDDLPGRQIHKGELLLKPGQICKTSFRVVSGCLRSYVLDKAGKEHTLQFAPEGWIVSDLESFTRQTPSNTYIDAVEESVVQEITKSIFPSFEELSQELQSDIGLKFQNNLIAANQRLVSLLSSSAEQRYIDFQKNHPELWQRLPQKYIASYLGMTPEHLSVVKKQLLER